MFTGDDFLSFSVSTKNFRLKLREFKQKQTDEAVSQVETRKDLPKINFKAKTTIKKQKHPKKNLKNTKAIPDSFDSLLHQYKKLE